MSDHYDEPTYLYPNYFANPGHPYRVDLNSYVNAQPPDYLIDGIIPEAQTTWLYGESGIGKSLLTLNMILQAITGQPVFGTHEPKQPLTAIWLDYENGFGELRQRTQTMGYDPLTIAATKQFLPIEYPPPISEQPEAIIEAVDAYEAQILVIDSIGVATDGESNSADTFSHLARHLFNPLKAIGCTPIILDNIGKDHTRGAIGSSRKKHEAGQMWQIERTTLGGLQLTNTKQRTSGANNKIILRRQEKPLTWISNQTDLPIRHNLDPEQQIMVQYLRAQNVTQEPTRYLQQYLRDYGFKGRDTYFRAAIRAAKDTQYDTPE